MGALQIFAFLLNLVGLWDAQVCNAPLLLFQGVISTVDNRNNQRPFPANTFLHLFREFLLLFPKNQWKRFSQPSKMSAVGSGQTVTQQYAFK